MTGVQTCALPILNPGEAIQLVLRIIDLLGVLANAILGGLIARNERFDPVGFVTLAIMTGLGGGMIRDVLLTVMPIALIDHYYLVMAVVGAGIAYFIPVHEQLWNRAFPLLDALALGCWAAAGTQKALMYGLAPLPAILLGTITAVGGGILRDITLRKVPQIFGGNTLYATPAMLASAVMVLLWGHVPGMAATLSAVFTGLVLTVLGQTQKWRLPVAYPWHKWRLGALPRPRWRLRRLRHRSAKSATP